MKKTIIFCEIFLSLLTTSARADIIPENAHFLNRCVKFVNLDKFPDIVLIGKIKPVTTGVSASTYQIQNGECLHKDYKFNNFEIYWNTKEQGLVTEYSKLLNSDINIQGGYVSNTDPKIKEDIEYSIAGMNKAVPEIFMSKKTTEYNNGAATKVEIFDNPLTKKIAAVTPTPQAKPALTNETADSADVISLVEPGSHNRGFWGTIVCFFRSWFGKSCQ